MCACVHVCVCTDWHPFVVQCLHKIYQGHPKQTVLTFYIKFIKQTLNTFLNCVYVYVFTHHGLSSVRLFATPWTVAHQAPLSKGFPRKAYWSELPFPSPGDRPDSGIKPSFPVLAGRFFTTEPPGKPY